MGELAYLKEAAARRDITIEEAFNLYKSAKLEADRTLALEDGLRAARAWRLFLEAFVGRPL